MSEDKYLDRCVTLKRYKITVYVEDEATAEQLYNDIMEYYENISYESEIEETIFGDETILLFSNNSTITIIPKTSIVPNISSHVVMLDSRIREKYVSECLKPIIADYDLDSGVKLLDPKPIHLKFVRDN